MPPASDPLTEPQIHAAIRALDAGDRPARATLRTALLMALAWHAAQAEIAGLRRTIAGLEASRYDPDTFESAAMRQFARTWNARIDALLHEGESP